MIIILLNLKQYNLDAKQTASVYDLYSKPSCNQQCVSHNPLKFNAGSNCEYNFKCLFMTFKYVSVYFRSEM